MLYSHNMWGVVCRKQTYNDIPSCIQRTDLNLWNKALKDKISYQNQITISIHITVTRSKVIDQSGKDKV